MAFANKFNKKRTDDVSITVIAKGTKIIGEIISDAVHIHGSFEGDIVSKGTVVVALDGYVKGKIKANSIVVSGLCEGSVDCDSLDILDQGMVDGDALCNYVMVEKNGFFQGTSKKKDNNKKDSNIDNSKVYSKDT